MAGDKILVVDDEEEICTITKSFLTKRNYQVWTAKCQEEALGVIKSEHPSIMLLDIRLGQESGLDILQKAKELDGNLKIIMVTALDDEETIRKARSLGADDYIAKPFTAKYLDEFILQKIAKLSAKDKTKQ